MKKEKQQINPYPIRLTLSLREKLQASAKKNGRSLNAEMLLRIESTFSDNPDQRFVDSIDVNEPKTKDLLTQIINDILDDRENTK